MSGTCTPGVLTASDSPRGDNNYGGSLCTFQGLSGELNVHVGVDGRASLDYEVGPPKISGEVGWLSEQNLPGFCLRSVVIRANLDPADAHVGWVVRTLLVPESPPPTPESWRELIHYPEISLLQ